jgi:hypothetical protein
LKLRPTVSRPVCLGVGLPSGTHDRISSPVLTIAGFLMCGALSDERMDLKFTTQLLLGLARAVTLGSKSRRTHDYILLSHLRLLQPGGPGPRIYIPQEPGGPVIPPGTGFSFRHLLRLAGQRWRYSNRPILGHENMILSTSGFYASSAHSGGPNGTCGCVYKQFEPFPGGDLIPTTPIYMEVPAGLYSGIFYILYILTYSVLLKYLFFLCKIVFNSQE